ncbi:MAG: hypothetical protein KAQ83_02475, partial [Nanoarchaeota archaeon]|nr:hypothetical protein [Nanoarchaeota archaeon]
QLGTNVVGSSEIAANAVKDSEIDYSVVTLADFTDDIGVSADYDTCSDVDTSCMNWTESDITDLDKYTQAEVNTEIDADVLVETNNRIADVDAEELARIADVDSEESARILDVDNEETRATGAENALDTRVLSLEGTDPLDYDSCLDVDTSCMSWTESDITDLDKYTQDEVDDISSDISGLRATSSGIKIQLTKGWTEFRLPAHILTGTNVGNYSGLNVTDYNIETVLDSINGSYNYVAYYDGTQWLVYEDDPTDTFLLFPTVANTPNHVFSIHMTETNTLEIAEK